MTAGRSQARWRLLLRPRWLAWHAFAVVATAGMLWLGDWQLHRAESGNELSWAYTFEWPLFAIFGVYFWVKSLRDELRDPEGSSGGSSEAERAEVAATVALPAKDRYAEDRHAEDSYAERLRAEVRGHGKWHGWR